MVAVGQAADKMGTVPFADRADAPSPRWVGLSNAQRQALKPLGPSWNSLSEAQRRKWIALSRNFDKLPVAEQQKLHQRMGDWVKLSAVERSRARLNFAETERLASDDKQAKWEAYQALSEEERRKLAEQAPRRTLPGAATAIRPISRQRLATMPVAPENQRTMPRIIIAPHLINSQTLLPQVDVHATDADAAHSQ
ncbi:DUF3106 domain-containing protein [Pseudorhodoferax sp. Leaf274]|uniref:DUF3106 domain-containing protein n=1 Tax=Pseudorhodoferax sp. Leaf274 TaxID=1736318 RepID=UPI000702B868|nr:DUF3106 domain-containing protein [Pseudorhodoferax sp. Leaf274]KQP38845.1 hypothetical protein ASF44_10385 [Pseudorhodoferax sp. Leaf274]